MRTSRSFATWCGIFGVLETSLSLKIDIFWQWLLLKTLVAFYLNFRAIALRFSNVMLPFDYDKHWVSRNPSLLKLNTNAAYCEFIGRIGFGCIIRDDHGQVVAFSCGRYEESFQRIMLRS